MIIKQAQGSAVGNGVSSPTPASSGSGGNNNGGIAEKMLLHLHEQYAINNNANLSSAVALIAAMIVVVGSYAYVFVHTTLCFSHDLGCLYCKDTDLYSLEVLAMMTIATVAVLCVPQVICICQGGNQRLEQFIIYAIRENSGLHDDGKILPEGYKPFGKGPGKSTCCLASLFGLKKGTGRIIQGLFGEILALLSIAQYLIIVLSVVKLSFSMAACPCWWIVATVVLSLVFMGFVGCYACKMVGKYTEREEEYKGYDKKLK